MLLRRSCRARSRRDHDQLSALEPGLGLARPLWRSKELRTRQVLHDLPPIVVTPSGLSVPARMNGVTIEIAVTSNAIFARARGSGHVGDACESTFSNKTSACPCGASSEQVERAHHFHAGRVERHQNHRLAFVVRALWVGEPHEDRDLAALVHGAQVMLAAAPGRRSWRAGRGDNPRRRKRCRWR